MNIKIIKCPYCRNQAADQSGKIICGTAGCEAYPPILNDENASLEEKIRALLSSGPKTIDVMAEILEEHRKVVSGVLYQMKNNQEVLSEYDSKLESFVWQLSQPKTVEFLTFGQKSALVMEALAAGKNLPRAIAKFAKLTEGETVITLTAMEEEGEIVRVNQTNFSAWFLKHSVPEGKLILDGNGGVMAVEVSKPVVSEEVRKKAEEDLEKQNQRIREAAQEMEINKKMADQNVVETAKEMEIQKQAEQIKITEKRENMANIEKPISAINAEIETTTNKPLPAEIKSSNETGGKVSTLRKGINYTEEMFVDFGVRKLSLKKMANELGVATGTIRFQLDKPHFKNAYQRGRDAALSVQAEKPKQKRTTIVWTEDLLEDLASRHFEVAPAAKEINVHFTALNKRLNTDSNLLRAWFRGLQKFIKENPDYRITRRSWYYKAQAMLKNELGEIPKTAEILKTFVSKFDHIEVALVGEEGVCHLKCRHCFMNRSFGLFGDTGLDNKRIEEALQEFEADHQNCEIKQPEAQPIEPVVINNRIGEVLERIHPTKQVGVAAVIGNGIQLPNYPEFSNDVSELQPIVRNPNQKTLNFSCGGNLNLNLDNFNIFEADEQTRMFLHNLINQIQEFEEAKSAENSFA